MVSARDCLIARADSSLPADARPTRKLLRAAGITIAATAAIGLGDSATRRMSLVRRDYDPLDGFRSLEEAASFFRLSRFSRLAIRCDFLASYPRGDAAVTHEISI